MYHVLNALSGKIPALANVIFGIVCRADAPTGMTLIIEQL